MMTMLQVHQKLKKLFPKHTINISKDIWFFRTSEETKTEYKICLVIAGKDCRLHKADTIKGVVKELCIKENVTWK